VRAGLIPTGEVAPVGGTPFDFRTSRVLAPPPIAGDPQLGLAGGYDHCWVLSKDADCSCELVSPERDLAMTMRGSGPGLQFYNGQFLARTYPALGSGLILEPQGFPTRPTSRNSRRPSCGAGSCTVPSSNIGSAHPRVRERSSRLVRTAASWAARHRSERFIFIIA
jgi:galactose mutarotase-like enzyme